MKNILKFLLLIILLINADSIFAQNKIYVGTIALKDTLVGGKHYLKINSNVMSYGNISTSDSIKVGDIILKDSSNILTINNDVVINGNLSFNASYLTLLALNSYQINFDDSTIIYKDNPLSQFYNNDLRFINKHYDGNMIFNFPYTGNNNKYEFSFGNRVSPDYYLRFNGKDGNLLMNIGEMYINGKALNRNNICYKDSNNTFNPTSFLKIGNLQLSNNSINVGGTNILPDIAYLSKNNKFTKMNEFHMGTGDVNGDEINIDNEGNLFQITCSSATLNSISINEGTEIAQDGTIITIIFAGTDITLKSSNTSNHMVLEKNIDFTNTTTAFSISFIYYSGVWWEISRIEY